MFFIFVVETIAIDYLPNCSAWIFLCLLNSGENNQLNVELQF